MSIHQARKDAVQTSLEQILKNSSLSSPSNEPTRFERRRKKCLVNGIDTRLLQSVEDVDPVFEPQEPYDFILLAAGGGREWFAEILNVCSNPIAPIVVADPFDVPDHETDRVDVVFRNPNVDGLASALNSLSPLISRVSSLPDIPVGPDREGLVTLALSHTRNRAIEPILQPNRPQGVDYPLLLGVDGQRLVLEELADAGLLRRRFFERFHTCEHCESSRIHAREVCVSCHSSYLTEAAIVHHYACGFQGAQPLFETGDGYRCPKCRKDLRHYGVDYDKPGIVLSCRMCESTMAEPDAYFVCLDCGKQTSSDRAAKRDWFAYDLTPDGLAALRQGKLPRVDICERDIRGYSPRDFKLVATQHLQLAERFGRPLSFWKLTIDVDDLTKTVGPSGAAEVLQLLREVILGEFRECDAVTFLPNKILACLPETDTATSAERMRLVEKRVKSAIRPRISISFKLIEYADAPRFLQEMH